MIASPRARRALCQLLALSISLVGVFAACSNGETWQDKTASAVAAVPTKPTNPQTFASPLGIPTDVGRGDQARLDGAGATFPAPLYTRWFSDYKNLVANRVEINYQAIGSGGGIQQITQQLVEFGASDAPMDEEELAAAPGIQHIPMTLGAVVMTYNVAGLDSQTPLKLDGPTIAAIYLGNIKKWNDPAIAAQNPGLTLPDSSIVSVHRSDGSGTSYVFTDYLSHVSDEWKNGPSTTKNPAFRTGLGGTGNAGVTQQVKQNKNSIGYVELAYALTNNLPLAQIKNKSGEYVTPSPDSTSIAAEGVTIPEDYRTSIVDSPTTGAYPISSFTYILAYKDRPLTNKRTALVDFLWWAIHDGQATTKELGYAPLPATVVSRVEKTLTTDILSDGKPMLTKA